MMYKAVYIIFIFSLYLFSVKKSDASVNTDINISNNSSSNSEVNVTTNTNSSTDDESDVRTKIKIESNGEVKEYESNEPGTIHVESSNGNTKVEVTNNSEPSQALKGVKIKEKVSTNAAQKERTESSDTTDKDFPDEQNLFEKIASLLKSIFFGN